LNIDSNLVDKASEMTGIKEKTTLVRLGLEALKHGKVRKGWLNWPGCCLAHYSNQSFSRYFDHRTIN